MADATCVIRQGRLEDMDGLMGMIRELAAYEKRPEMMVAQADSLGGHPSGEPAGRG